MVGETCEVQFIAERGRAVYDELVMLRAGRQAADLYGVRGADVEHDVVKGEGARRGAGREGAAGIDGGGCRGAACAAKRAAVVDGDAARARG